MFQKKEVSLPRFPGALEYVRTNGQGTTVGPSYSGKTESASAAQNTQRDGHSTRQSKVPPSPKPGRELAGVLGKLKTSPAQVRGRLAKFARPGWVSLKRGSAVDWHPAESGAWTTFDVCLRRSLPYTMDGIQGKQEN